MCNILFRPTSTHAFVVIRMISLNIKNSGGKTREMDFNHDHFLSYWLTEVQPRFRKHSETFIMLLMEILMYGITICLQLCWKVTEYMSTYP